MYDRLIPHELLESTEFVDLNDDTYRLLLIGLNLRADDFGNQEADRRQLLRWAVYFTQIKTADALAAALSALEGAGLVRGYVVEGKPYLNLPGFRNARSYYRRLCPPSPWCDRGARTGAYAAGMRARNRAAFPVAMPLAENTSQINGATPKSESGLPIEVGVGQETKNSPQLPGATRLPAAWALPAEWMQWAIGFWWDQGRPLTGAQVRAMASQFHAHWRSRTGRNGRQINWFGTWRVFVRRAGAGDRTLYSSGNGAAPAEHASRTGSDRLHQAG